MATQCDSKNKDDGGWVQRLIQLHLNVRLTVTN